jgi:TPR repeat protein
MDICVFCKANRMGKTDEENAEEIMRRVEVNDASAIFMLANYYEQGSGSLRQDSARAVELYARAAELDNRKAHYSLANIYYKGGDLKKAKLHYEAAAMAGHEIARTNLGCMEDDSGNLERAVKHWMMAASARNCDAMHNFLSAFEDGLVSRESIDSTLTAYNTSCAEMRSEARDICIHLMTERE